MLGTRTKAKKETDLLMQGVEKWLCRVMGESLERLLIDGRELMENLGRIVPGTLLIKDAEDAKDEIASEILRRWVVGDGMAVTKSAWNESHAWNQKSYLVLRWAEKSKL